MPDIVIAIVMWFHPILTEKIPMMKTAIAMTRGKNMKITKAINRTMGLIDLRSG